MKVAQAVSHALEPALDYDPVRFPDELEGGDRGPTLRRRVRVPCHPSAPMHPPPERAGRQAGARGERAGSNRHQPGSAGHEAWARGFAAWAAMDRERQAVHRAQLRAYGRRVIRPSRRRAAARALTR